MTDFDAQKVLSAAPVSAAALMEAPPSQRPAKLSQSALDVVANEPREAAYSPIVLSGFVRLTEFILILLIGFALYFGWVGPATQEPWVYASAVLTIATCAILAFQAAELYDIHAFRRPVNQMAKLVSVWAFVFLLGTAVTFFGKLGEQFSRVWLSRASSALACSRCSRSRLVLYTSCGAGCGKAGSRAAPSSSAAARSAKR